jgi:hypothetical protein
MGQRMMRRAAKVIDDKLNHFALSLDCTPSFTEVKTNDTAILDSGCTSIFLISNCIMQQHARGARSAKC